MLGNSPFHLCLSTKKCTYQYGMKCNVGKREQNRLKRRAGIVEIATQSFLSQGYAATSMSAIADKLGGSKATLWSHFASKEDLFIAVVDEEVEQFAHAMEDALTDEPFSIEGLRRYGVSFLRTLLTPHAIEVFRLIIGDGGRFPEINEIFHVRGPARLARFLTEFYATRFDAEEAERMALLTNVTLTGFRGHILTRPEPARPGELERFVDDFIAHLRLPQERIAPPADIG